MINLGCRDSFNPALGRLEHLELDRRCEDCRIYEGCRANVRVQKDVRVAGQEVPGLFGETLQVG